MFFSDIRGYDIFKITPSFHLHEKKPSAKCMHSEMITECTQDPSSSLDNFSNKEHTRKRLVRNIPATAIASPLQVPALDLKNEILFSYQEKKIIQKDVP